MVCLFVLKGRDIVENRRPYYKRILLKLSGEAIASKKIVNLEGENKEIIEEIFDGAMLEKIAQVIRSCIDKGVQVGIVIGAGNIWRGKMGVGVTRARADHMGMLATTINCLRVQDALEKVGLDAHVMTAVPMNSYTEPFYFKEAIAYLEKGCPVLFGAGTGVPFVSTDTAAVVRACEIQADVLLMAKSVDGIYDRDPSRDPENAVKYKTLSYSICLRDALKATDPSASAIAEEQKLDSYVFSLEDPENIIRVACGEQIGTLVTWKDLDTPEVYTK